MRQSNSRGVKPSLQKQDSTFLFDHFLNNKSPPNKFARPSQPKRQESQMAHKITNLIKNQQQKPKVNLVKGRKLVSTSVNLTEAAHNSSSGVFGGSYLTHSESSQNFQQKSRQSTNNLAIDHKIF